MRIGLASPELIRSWSHGEVKKPETINYRTLKPETDGLFCERIFGPVKDWECHCGKYKRIRYKGIVCDKCGVEVTRAKVRRDRMGHIELATPVSHIWYFKGIPSRMGLILDISPRALERVLYFVNFIVLDPGETGLTKKQLLTEAEYKSAVDKYGKGAFRAEMGAAAVKELLEEIDVDKLVTELREELKDASGQKKVRIVRRLEVAEAFQKSGNKPSWMILDVIPVIPPDLRPMVQLDGGRFATSDLNDLYRRVINRNNRLKRLLDLHAPDIIVRNEKRMLQEAVDALIDNGRRGRPVTGPGNRPLKSLSDMLKGKQGRFRQNLLGKRVDYSGRSVIVVGPEMKMHQCGLPKEMALELFKPFVMKRLQDNDPSRNIRAAKRMVERPTTEVWDVLEEVIKEHPVLLNRAPTLHRLGIQAFEPILTEGRAITLHPLVCTAYNADFDGDQMAVHLPLSVEAQAEARMIMLSVNNILAPKDGKPVAVPTQDMVLGAYYLTIEKPGAKGEGKRFSSMDEALMAYDRHFIDVEAKITIRIPNKDIYPEPSNEGYSLVDTTIGNAIYNEALPTELRYYSKRTDENGHEYWHLGQLITKKELGKLVAKAHKLYGNLGTANVLDIVKKMGYDNACKSGLSIAVSDIHVPEGKQEIIAKSEKLVDKTEAMYRRGLMTNDERYKKVVDIWNKATDDVADLLKDMNAKDKFNPIAMMADSGARGSIDQIKQLAGMRGLMADTTGHTIELPITSNFREGLDVLEYFMSAHGARKGLSDTALRTADSGYLTRRLVDVSQELIIRETDCAANRKEIPGMWVSEFSEGHGDKKSMIESLQERITGRFAAQTIYDKNGEVIVKANHMITPKRAERVMKEGVGEDGGPITRVKIRTILTCRSKLGICVKCYGANMATGEAVQVGEAVGVIAAQSIGEPGTQLTMRTFHTGGVAGGDITQGLPRVEELFEARKPKGLAIISEIPGRAQLIETKKKTEVVVTNENAPEGSKERQKTYLIPYGSRLLIQDNAVLEAGDAITEGSINPHDIMKIRGERAVQDYMLREVQKVYRQQGVEINDKHIEVIVRQMLKKVRIEKPGDTGYLSGSLVDYLEADDLNEKLIEEGKEPAELSRVVLGITKSALATNSFLSAAAFQETTKVLTDAAIKGKVDPLIGLKENVIIGQLIPAGTGLRRYRNIRLDTDARIEEEKKAKEAMIVDDGPQAGETAGDASDAVIDDAEENESLDTSAPVEE